MERADVERQIAALDLRISAAAKKPKQEAGPKRDQGPWTPERVSLLKKMWLEGHSANEIAATLGGTKRNAVIGKAKRLGLPFIYGKENPTDSSNPTDRTKLDLERELLRRLERSGDGAS
ncbi:hypothetical protein G6N82_10365 [Altererythrobacter sp. BO-6]|nr:hypothetical protein G6N82_10365 [Altererythrobacter sp. BO-6]